MFTMIPIPTTRYIYSMNLLDIPYRKEDDLKLIEYIDKLSKEHYPQTQSNVMSWRSEWNSHNVHREVMKCFLGDLFRVFTDDMIFPTEDGTEIYLADSWMSVQRKGDWIRRHAHFTYFHCFSFCYYLNMGKDSAPIRFHQYNLPAPTGRISDKVLDIYPSEGTLLIFDAENQHSVDNTIDDRFTVSGNIMFMPKDSSFNEESGYLYINDFFNEN